MHTFPRFSSPPLLRNPLKPRRPFPVRFEQVEILRFQRIVVGGWFWILIGSTLVALGTVSMTPPILGIGCACIVLGFGQVVYGSWKQARRA